MKKDNSWVPKAEAIIFFGILAFTIVSVLWPNSDKPIFVPKDQDQIARHLIEAIAHNQVETASGMLTKEALALTPTGALEKIANLVQENGALEEIFPIRHFELKGNIFGKSVNRVSSLTYAIKTEKDFVYEAWLKLDLETNPISVSSFRLQPLGFSRDVHAFIPSGANAGSGIAWFVMGIVFLISAGLILVWVLALRKVWKSSLRHRWIWALLLFVNVIPIQFFIASGGYSFESKVTFLSLPLQIFSQTSFYPYVLQLQFPIGALLLHFKFRMRAEKRIETVKG